jgi:hypothetical protein
MLRGRRSSPLAIVISLTMVSLITQSAEADEGTVALAATAQNPVAAMYSLPFQNNTYFRRRLKSRPDRQRTEHTASITLHRW